MGLNIEEEVFRYLIVLTINDKSEIKAVTNVLNQAIPIYESYVNRYHMSNKNVNIRLYDMELDTNIKEYDSSMDRC